MLCKFEWLINCILCCFGDPIPDVKEDLVPAGDHQPYGEEQ